MSAYIFSFFEVMCFLFIFVQYCEGSGCSKGYTGFTEVLPCLQNVTHGLNNNNILAGTSTTTIQKYCQEGVFNDTVKCLRSLYGQCGNQRGQEHLSRYARPDIWQQGANAICNNLNVHANYSKCIVQLKPIIERCLHANDKRFLQLTDLKGNFDKLTFNICRYYKGMRICTGRPVRDECDNKVGELLEDYVYSITPLVCHDNYKPHSSTTAFPTAVHSVITFSILLSLFFAWGT